MDNLIFLDIDGVLNCQDGYTSKQCKYIDLLVNGVEDRYQTFYEPSKSLLNGLIEKTNAKIVISSSWRHSGLDFIKAVWLQEEMSGEIIGLTPTYDIITPNGKKGATAPRGCEIQQWLLDEKDYSNIFWNKDMQDGIMSRSGVRNYIIIDDDSDMLYNQRNNFVHVLPPPRNFSGFNQEHYNKALYILEKTILEINYEDLLF
jgi:hypothetical protein